MTRLLKLIMVSAAFAALASPGFAIEVPWRLSRSIDAPDWLTLSGSYRVRYESLGNDYRANATGSSQILVERLLLNAQVNGDGAFYADAELEDSRAQLDNLQTPLGTDSVNTFEPLQFYVGGRFNDVFEAGDKLDVRAGRITIDVGSRRFVARNSYRNTINNFTGVDTVWTSVGGTTVHALYVLPVQRRPSDRESLEDNATRMDGQNSHVRFWGLLVSRADLFGNITGEAYIFGLHQHDYPGVATADRDLYTPGFRLFTRPADGMWDYQVEAALQFGTSRATTSIKDTKNLNHSAEFIHADIGYTWHTAWSPRLEGSYDYASGDRDPSDGDNNRFDTLYGARRFDFGPTGIYGAVARSNISTPGLRVAVKPASDLSAMIGYRTVWLASNKDQFTTGKIQDPTGKSGSFVGNQIEARLQYALMPGNLSLEVGGAYLFHGEFLNNATTGPKTSNTAYFYTMASFTF